MRIVGGTERDKINTNKNVFIRFQFILKGLGSYQTEDIKQLLTSNMPGFYDRFQNRGLYNANI